MHAATAVSRDGTSIGYRVVDPTSPPSRERGSLVLIQGSFGTSAHFQEFAALLADTAGFRVVLPDRRGRGLSPAPFPADSPPSVLAQLEAEDVEAVLLATGATRVFALSSGAMVALEAVRMLLLRGGGGAGEGARITKLVLYEPPFFTEHLEQIQAGIEAFQREMAAGRVSAGMVTAMRLGQFAPWYISNLPRPFLQGMTSLAMWADSKPGGRYPPLRDLALSTRFDFAVVSCISGRGLDAFRDLPQFPPKILLLGGSNSPAYLRQALDALERVLPPTSTTRLEIAGVGHGATWNRDRGGNPAVVVPVVEKFFLDQDGE